MESLGFHRGTDLLPPRAHLLGDAGGENIRRCFSRRFANLESCSLCPRNLSRLVGKRGPACGNTIWVSGGEFWRGVFDCSFASDFMGYFVGMVVDVAVDYSADFEMDIQIVLWKVRLSGVGF